MYFEPFTRKPFGGFRPGTDTIGTVQSQKIHGTLKFQLAAQLICVFISQYAKAGFLMMCPIIRVEPSYDFKKFCHVQSGSKLFANGKNRR